MSQSRDVVGALATVRRAGEPSGMGGVGVRAAGGHLVADSPKADAPRPLGAIRAPRLAFRAVRIVFPIERRRCRGFDDEPLTGVSDKVNPASGDAFEL